MARVVVEEGCTGLGCLLTPFLLYLCQCVVKGCILQIDTYVCVCARLFSCIYVCVSMCRERVCYM